MEETKNYGIETLIRAVERDLKKDLERVQRGTSTMGRGCAHYNEKCADNMRQYEKTVVLCGHKCEYCEKFKWVIDRAKHYAEKTGLSVKEVLESWEEHRSYWFLNYYQDCNQPELKGETVFFASVEEWRKSVGDKGFRCPMCGGVSTDPCECNSGLPMKNGKTCDWKTYGFIPSGISVYFVKERRNARIFKPIAWGEENGND